MLQKTIEYTVIDQGPRLSYVYRYVNRQPDRRVAQYEGSSAHDQAQAHAHRLAEKLAQARAEKE